MKYVAQCLIFAIVTLPAGARLAHGQICVTSDGAADTACGTGTLTLGYSQNGAKNSAFGENALQYNTSGSGNTAVGAAALLANLQGDNNTATGYHALTANTNGNENTGSGVNALFYNTTGYDNTAVGMSALINNRASYFNTAVGANSLGNNDISSAGTAVNNTAVGAYTLFNNRNANSNTALGYEALAFNDDDATAVANNNTAVGVSALRGNTDGYDNSAIGYQALTGNTTGYYGTAVGYLALYNSQTGFGNIGVGPLAGHNIIHGQLNIDIGSWGSADESSTIRIGLPQYHLTTYIAGIGNSAIAGGTPVVVNRTTGQLGYAGSAERYKTDIIPLGDATEKLSQLRPISFHVKADPAGALQYGLIAEEVDKVYPELVIRDDDGKIQGVRYDELAPLLLNEMQKEHLTVATLVAQHQADAARIASLEEQLSGIRAALSRITPEEQPTAQQ